MAQQTMLYWTLLEHGKWRLHVAATKLGICYIGSNQASFDELKTWGERHFTNIDWIEDTSSIETNELIEYLEGRRMSLEGIVDLRGTVFQQQVWALVKEIPYGMTASYMDIAERLGRPQAVRAVGRAIGANPVLFFVPCHRVISKSGKLTGFRGGLQMKASLLQLENESVGAMPY